MIFYLLGIDHNSATFEEREALYRKKGTIAELLKAGPGNETIIFATCNRIEIYGVEGDINDARLRIKKLRKKFPELAKGYFVSGERNVFRHAVRLASGLESQIKGEAEIFSQLEQWLTKEIFPWPIIVLWQKAMEAAHRIRQNAPLYKVTVNIADIILDDLEKEWDLPEKPAIVIIGTGRVAGLFAAAVPDGIRCDFIANKNRRRAEELSSLTRGMVFSFNALSEAIAGADIVISATKSPHFVVRKSDILPAMSARNRKLYIYDVSLPRDVEPSISKIEKVVLKDLASLFVSIKRYNESVKKYVQAAEAMAEEAVKIYGVGVDERKSENRDTAECSRV